MFVLRGFWSLASWSREEVLWLLWAADKATPGEGVEIPPPWLDCPTLAGCRPPISVGHQGNRATLGPEPGDAQPRLGLEDGGGWSLKGLPAASRNDSLGSKPPTQAVYYPPQPQKNPCGGRYPLLAHCCLIHVVPTLKSQELSATVGAGMEARDRGPCVWGGRGVSVGG